MPEDTPSHYDILGVARDAGAIEIRAAYLKLVKIYHPDRASPARRAAALQIFQMITLAYATLSKPEARKKYDSTLRPLGGAMNDNAHNGFWASVASMFREIRQNA